MADVKWTKEQQDAIYDKGSNILVAAAAGSGKTAVLVERIINKVINENEINKVEKDEKGFFIENNENSIKINIKMNTNGKTYQMETFYNNDITKFVENFNLVKFRCNKIEYHKKSGRVSKLYFEEILE